MHSGDVTDGETKEPSRGHEHDEMEGEEVPEGDDLWQFSRHHNQGDKQDQSVDIVVKCQEPAVERGIPNVVD